MNSGNMSSQGSMSLDEVMYYSNDALILPSGQLVPQEEAGMQIAVMEMALLASSDAIGEPSEKDFTVLLCRCGNAERHKNICYP